jgi:hypothetical protein
MTARADIAHMPDWPRLLSRVQAAEYAGLSPNTFDQHIKVEPIRLGKRVLFDRLQLDRFIDTLSGVRRSREGWASRCELD